MAGKIIRSLAWCAVVVALIAAPAQAVTYTWIGANNATWSTTGTTNWSPTGAPAGGGTDSTVFAVGQGGLTVSVPSTQTVISTTINRDTTFTGAGFVNTGTNLTVANNVNVSFQNWRLTAGSSGTAFNSIGSSATVMVLGTGSAATASATTLGAGSILTFGGPVNFSSSSPPAFFGSGTVAYSASSGTSNGFRFSLGDTVGFVVKSTATATTGTALTLPFITVGGTNTLTLERSFDLMTPVTSGSGGALILGLGRSSTAPGSSLLANAAATVSGPSTLSVNLLGVINSSSTALQKLVVDNGAAVQVGDFSVGKAQGLSVVDSSLAYFLNASNSGTFQLDSASGGTLRVNANSSFNAATAASGSNSLGLGIAVTGSATLVNNGAWTNRNFANTTILQGLSVAQTATLSGTGSFLMTSGNSGQTIGKSVAIDGTVAPGDVVAGVNGVGTLTINSGTVTFGSASKVAIGGSGATLDRLVLNAPVSVTSGAKIDFAGTSNLTQGRYQVLTGSSGVNTFTASNAPAAYSFGTSGTDAYLWAKPVFGTITATPAAAQVITGGTVAFSYTVANAAPTGGQDLAFTSAMGSGVVGTVSGTTTVAPGAAGGSLSGFSYVGATPGLAQAGTFTVSDPNAFATSATGTVALDVLAHATPGFATAAGASILDPFATGTISLDFGSLDSSDGKQILTYSLTNLASQAYGSSLTAGLALTGFTANGDGFESGLATFASLAAGNTSSIFSAAFTPTTEGSFSRAFTLTFYDNQSVAGSTQQRNLTVNMQAVVVPEPGALAIAGVGVILTGWQLARRGLRGRSCSTRP